MSIPFFMGRIIDLISSGELVEDKVNLKGLPAPKIASSSFERLTSKINRDNLYPILITTFAVGAVSNACRVYLFRTSGDRIVARLRTNLYRTILSQHIPFFDRNKTGELISRLSTDTMLVSRTISNNVSDGLRSLTTTTIGALSLIYLSPTLSMTILAILPPLAIGARLYGRFVRKLSRQVQDALADTVQEAEERIGNVRTVKAFSKVEQETHRFDVKIQHVLDLARKENLAAATFFSSAGMSGNVVMLAILYLGSGMISSGTLTVGELVSFMLYSGYVGGSMMGLTSFWTDLQKGLGASQKVFAILQDSPSTQHGIIIENFKGRIEFQDVHFAYPNRPDAQIFTGLSFIVEPGRMLGIVGTSGGGKSTILGLLLRLYDPQRGKILVDGIDLQLLDTDWWRSKMVSLIPQDAVLWSESIKSNIEYGATSEQLAREDLDNLVLDAASQANALPFIQRLPEGWNTLVGERGVSLSGGQRQRIAIARALLKEPKVLVADEYSSALDSESELLVREALNRVMKGRTTLVVAHRLSTLKGADLIVVLDGGFVAEQGSFEELMRLENGHFKKLVEHQSAASWQELS
jgi:ABC-type multidrug transport system fused ATPase/permease subunit